MASSLRKQMMMNDGSAAIVMTVRSSASQLDPSCLLCSQSLDRAGLVALKPSRAHASQAAPGAVTTSHPLSTQVKRLPSFSLAGGKFIHSAREEKKDFKHSPPCFSTFPSSTMLLAVFSVCHSMDQGVKMTCGSPDVPKLHSLCITGLHLSLLALPGPVPEFVC